MAELKVELAPTGFTLTSPDAIIVQDHPDPGSVPNTDTIPMVMREESFLDRRPGSKEPKFSVPRQIVSVGPVNVSTAAGAVAKPIQDRISSQSPWNTQIRIDNQCNTPLQVYLARNPDKPTVKNSIVHAVPAQASYVIQSGWLKEPLATLIMRLGVHEAKIFRMPHMAQLKVEPAPTGLKVTSTDEMIVEEHLDPGSVPNNDTMPMVLRQESFSDRQPGSNEPRVSTCSNAHQTVSEWPLSPKSPLSWDASPPQFGHGRQIEEEVVVCAPEATTHG